AGAREADAAWPRPYARRDVGRRMYYCSVATRASGRSHERCAQFVRGFSLSTLICRSEAQNLTRRGRSIPLSRNQHPIYRGLIVRNYRGNPTHLEPMITICQAKAASNLTLV